MATKYSTELELLGIRMARAGLRAHGDGCVFDGAMWLDETLSHETAPKGYPVTVGRLMNGKTSFGSVYRHVREFARDHAYVILNAQLLIDEEDTWRKLQTLDADRAAAKAAN